MMNAKTQEITYVNHAYSTITGYSASSLKKNPTAYRDLIHSEDRIRILSRLQDVADSGTFDEEFRFVRADSELRWAWAKGFPVKENGVTRWLVGTAQDITSRKQAEMQIAAHLDAAERARAEAEAFRKSTLALSQNLAMDSVLDTLLQCISELVPYDTATVLFADGSADLMVARVVPKTEPCRIGLTFRAEANTFLARSFHEQRSILLPDVTNEVQWEGLPPSDHIKSWLGVPLIAGNEVLGILSLGARVPKVFTHEHLRLAKSLAIPASVAIKNARTHERAEIYAAELEINLQELRNAQRALKLADRTVSRSTTI